MNSQLITAQQVQDWCLEMPGSYADAPFGPENTVYRLRGSKKMFALLWGTPPKVFADVPQGAVVVNLKCEPALGEQLRNAYPQIRPGYHMNKTHWISVVMMTGNGMNKRMLRDLIEDSHDLVSART